MDYSVVTELIFAYASGDFSKKGVISERRDELDMLIAGINMLGEELQATTVSRDYFSSIYDAVTDMIVVLDRNGAIEDVNSSFLNETDISIDELKGRSMDEFIQLQSGQLSTLLFNGFKAGNKSIQTEATLNGSDNTSIPVNMHASQIFKKTDTMMGYLLILEDIREKIERESLVLRTIVETQEAERRRVADDLHDSLGQKLSAVKIYLNALGANQNAPKSLKDNVKFAKQIVDESIQDLRDIVFAQMPVTLERFGLQTALKELVNRVQGPSYINFQLEIDDSIPTLPKDLEVVIYRITQEFMQNSIKHSQANNVYIDLMMRKNSLMVHLEDDGLGFDPEAMNDASGRGLRNMVTRAKAFHGTYKIKTSPGKGVKFSILFNLAKS